MALALHKKWFDPILLDSGYYAIVSISIGIFGFTILYMKFRTNLHSIIDGIICFGGIFVLIVWEIWSFIRSIYLGASRLDKSA
jgi:hypothetical protein